MSARPAWRRAPIWLALALLGFALVARAETSLPAAARGARAARARRRVRRERPLHDARPLSAPLAGGLGRHDPDPGRARLARPGRHDVPRAAREPGRAAGLARAAARGRLRGQPLERPLRDGALLARGRVRRPAGARLPQPGRLGPLLSEDRSARRACADALRHRHRAEAQRRAHGHRPARAHGRRARPGDPHLHEGQLAPRPRELRRVQGAARRRARAPRPARAREGRVRGVPEVVSRRRGRRARATASRRAPQRERQAAREELHRRARVVLPGRGRVREPRYSVSARGAGRLRERKHPARLFAVLGSLVSTRARTDIVGAAQPGDRIVPLRLRRRLDGNETRISAVYVDAAQRNGPWSGTIGRQPGNTAGTPAASTGCASRGRSAPSGACRCAAASRSSSRPRTRSRPANTSTA